MESALISRFGDRRVLITTKNGQLICIAPGDQDDVLTFFAKQAYAATDGSEGRCRAPAERRGRRGAQLRGGAQHPRTRRPAELSTNARGARAADMLVYPVLARDRQAMADLVLRC